MKQITDITLGIPFKNVRTENGDGTYSRKLKLRDSHNKGRINNHGKEIGYVVGLHGGDVEVSVKLEGEPELTFVASAQTIWNTFVSQLDKPQLMIKPTCDFEKLVVAQHYVNHLKKNIADLHLVIEQLKEQLEEAKLKKEQDQKLSSEERLQFRRDEYNAGLIAENNALNKKIHNLKKERSHYKRLYQELNFKLRQNDAA